MLGELAALSESRARARAPARVPPGANGVRRRPGLTPSRMGLCANHFAICDMDKLCALTIAALCAPRNSPRPGDAAGAGPDVVVKIGTASC